MKYFVGSKKVCTFAPAFREREALKEAFFDRFTQTEKEVVQEASMYVIYMYLGI